MSYLESLDSTLEDRVKEGLELAKKFFNEELDEFLDWLKKHPNDFKLRVYQEALASLLETRWYVELGSFIFVGSPPEETEPS